MSEKNDTTKKSQKLLMIALGFLVGVFGFGLYRFVTFGEDHTHYHANFSVYVDGEQEQFESFSYYEELTACSLDTTPTAKGRVHMHEPENSVVHVHDDAVTWGHFFENLGYSVGDQHMSNGTDLYTESDDQTIHYILNGEAVKSPTGKAIGDEDRLLVVVGTATEEDAIEFFETVPEDAHEHNESSDPGACNSNEGYSFTDRLKGVF